METKGRQGACLLLDLDMHLSMGVLQVMPHKAGYYSHFASSHQKCISVPVPGYP